MTLHVPLCRETSGAFGPVAAQIARAVRNKGRKADF